VKEKLASLPSTSRLTELFREPAFKRVWGQLAFRAARHLIHLRKFRGISQSDVADRMGTSQSKVARIEAGEVNLTLKSLERAAHALNGRVCLAIEPAEMEFPKMPDWWKTPHLACASPLQIVGTARFHAQDGIAIGAGWLEKRGTMQSEASAPVSWYEVAGRDVEEAQLVELPQPALPEIATKSLTEVAGSTPTGAT
jgi:DNA-binding XRE family transcriptional regulator